MAKTVDIRESGPMTQAQGEIIEKLLLLICGQMGLILTAMSKTMPPGEEQSRLKQAAIQMTLELGQIYSFESHVQ